MELSLFISETLKEIIKGVKDAQPYAKENGACINPYVFGAAKPKHVIDMGKGTVSMVQPVLFDLCVETTKTKKGKARIQVVSGNMESASKTVNRVNFSIAVSLPRMKPNFDTSNPETGVSKIET